MDLIYTFWVVTEHAPHGSMQENYIKTLRKAGRLHSPSDKCATSVRFKYSVSKSHISGQRLGNTVRKLHHIKENTRKPLPRRNLDTWAFPPKKKVVAIGFHVGHLDMWTPTTLNSSNNCNRQSDPVSKKLQLFFRTKNPFWNFVCFESKLRRWDFVGKSFRSSI